ncbi:hypothetical protein [Amycolatopsis sp. NPDC098790]|uniref:hypothetical protein n=1 Tax=Amycolatopsis sp. NPDC098790 TaxID=3363939 RepID=UPI0037F63F68
MVPHNGVGALGEVGRARSGSTTGALPAAGVQLVEGVRAEAGGPASRSRTVRAGRYESFRDISSATASR